VSGAVTAPAPAIAAPGALGVGAAHLLALALAHLAVVGAAVGRLS
jgi:hypothetical protein